MGLLSGDPRDLTQAGWGVIFAEKDAKQVEKIRDALTPLLTLRKQQVTRLGMGKRYREYYGRRGYREGEGKRAFLEDRGATTGEVNPDEMPYYLLIVGDPRDIPYEFQCLLDVERAVGRLCFGSVEEYARYARRVVAAEDAMAARERRAVFFAPRYADDNQSSICVDHLLMSIARHVSRQCAGWQIQKLVGDKASKKQLARVLRGPAPPDFLFTVGYGMESRPENPRQLGNQEALVCHEWPGRFWKERVPTEFYFSNDDLERVTGSLIAFFFACFSGGVPAWRRSCDLDSGDTIPPHPFVTDLLRALRGRFEEGALAIIGHVNFACVDLFHRPDGQAAIKRRVELTQFVEKILQGYPVGAAMEIFGRRYAALATVLSEEVYAMRRGKTPDEETALRLCVCQDALSCILLGDPAVRLAPLTPTA